VATKEFIQSLVSGSKEHWSEFISSYSRLIYKTFYSPGFHFSKEEIDDLFNDFMLSIFKDNCRKIRLFEGRNNCSLHSYLRKIAVNLAIDRQKRLIREKGLSLNQPSFQKDDNELGDFVEAPGPEPVAPLEDEEDRLRYLWALYRLDVPKFLVIVLVIYHEMDREKIAATLRTTRQNIDVIFKRAKDRLNALLGQKKSAEALTAPPLEWDAEITAMRNAVVAMNRGEMLERCLKKLDVPDELLVALLFANSAILRPSPDRMAALFKSSPQEEAIRAVTVLEKIGASTQ
jgi:RNA polymerase sigma factor (sigma-70 family)